MQERVFQRDAFLPGMANALLSTTWTTWTSGEAHYFLQFSPSLWCIAPQKLGVSSRIPSTVAIHFSLCCLLGEDNKSLKAQMSDLRRVSFPTDPWASFMLHFWECCHVIHLVWLFHYCINNFCTTSDRTKVLAPFCCFALIVIFNMRLLHLLFTPGISY